ncbi:MAG: hypothetical protein HN540_03070 [Rhodospirillaceae bacterium]|jgi:hypothetical protein|nr:hypothetical protein [Rhodospirillaceae bacterium]
MIAGNADVPIRIRAIHSDRKSQGTHPPQEYEGTLADISERTRKLNGDGYNIYMVAQPTKPLTADGHFTRDADIIDVRCLYADGDDSDLPSEWHVEPTFILVHPKTERWWAYWTVSSFPLDDLRDMIKRIAICYDSDPSISNSARIVRLAGFDRWKDGENFGPYELQRRSGISSEQWEHQGLEQLPSRVAYAGPKDAESVIELGRLQQLLLLVPPGDRDVWLKVMFMIRDGTVIDDKFDVLDEADKLTLFDSWASGDLYTQMTGVSP